MEKRSLAAGLLVLCVLLGGCAADPPANVGSVSSGASSQETAAENISEMFTDRDLEIGYDEETAARILLSGSGASCDSEGVLISEGTVTITEEGVYILSGTLDDGMIVVDAKDSDKIQLVLDGADISSAASAAIYVRQADKVFLTTAPDSQNRLANGGEYTDMDGNSIDAAVFSKSDLTLNGSGSLTVQAQAGHGIVSKDDLVFASGSYTVSAQEHCICGKDSVRIANGSYTIVSGKDGIHAENNDDSELGFLFIGDGRFDITAGGDGLSAGNSLLVEDGEFTVCTGGGSEIPGNDRTGFGQTGAAEDSVSTKGLKAAAGLTVNGGTFTIDSADDALHSNAALTVGGGKLVLASGDDGIHADGAVSIRGGTIEITGSYEGIEGLTIEISGGDIRLTAEDDGLNAAGGNDSSGFGGRGGDRFAAEEGVGITISGGTLRIDASGDGIDSNGSLTVTGGETYVSGPTNSGNGALDYGTEAVISGGTLVAAGPAGMAQNFGPNSTQGAMLVMVENGKAGSTVTLFDGGGQTLLSWQAEKAFSCVVISCPGLQQGSTYTLDVDGEAAEITMDSLIYGSGGMGWGRNGEKPGEMGGKPNEDRSGLTGGKHGGGNEGSFGPGRPGEAPEKQP